MCSVICIDIQAHIYTHSYMYVAGCERWREGGQIQWSGGRVKPAFSNGSMTKKKKNEFANGLNDSTSRPETCPLCALTHVS